MEAYLGEIRTFASNTIPRGWAACNGQLLSIPQNSALFSLLGVQYGGDGRTTFALPNLQGNVMLGQGVQRAIGFKYGSEKIALTKDQIPKHNHLVRATSALAKSFPGTTYFAQMVDLPTANATSLSPINAYAPLNTANPNLVILNTNTVPNGGTSAPHENRSPFLTMSVCIATTGIFPSRP